MIDALVAWSADACPASATVRSALAAVKSVLAFTPAFQRNPAGDLALERTCKALQREANERRPSVPRVTGAPKDGIGGLLSRLLTSYKAAGRPRTFIHARNRLVALLTIDCLGRNSDMARLQLEDVNLHADDDMHLTLQFRGDKAHVAAGTPHGAHAVSHIFCTTPKALCTVCAMRRYLLLRPEGGTFLFVQEPVTTTAPPTGLKPATVAHILKRSLTEGGAAGATPHAIRGMGASALFAANWGEGDIRRAGRWASIASVRPYTSAPLTALLPRRNIALVYADHGACVITKERRRYAGATLRRFMHTD